MRARRCKNCFHYRTAFDDTTFAVLSNGWCLAHSPICVDEKENDYMFLAVEIFFFCKEWRTKRVEKSRASHNTRKPK